MWFGYKLLDYFLSLFPLCELSHFSTSMYRQWVPCERNSSYNLIPILLKLCTCFLHGLKIAYGLDILLAFIFVTFSILQTLSFSDLRSYENVVTVGTL